MAIDAVSPDERSFRALGPIAAGRWMRRGGLGLVAGVTFWAVNGIAYTGIGLAGLAGLVSGRMDGPIGWALAGIISMLALGGMLSWTAVGMARAGLRISSEEIVLRRVLNTHRFVPVEVEEFVPGPVPAGFDGTSGVALVHRDGRKLPIWALRGRGYRGRDSFEEALAELQPLCDELNTLLRETKGE